MLPSQRRRLEENARLDAEGTPWQTEVTKPARIRIAASWDYLMREQLLSPNQLAQVLQRDAGWQSSQGVLYPDGLIQCANNELVLDMIAVAAHVITGQETKKVYEEFVNHILNEERIGHKFVDGELIAFQNDELMQEAVEPALKLLIGKRYTGAQKSYREALEQISHEKAGNAITYAGTALQETLEALGCKGNALGALITDAKEKGLLGKRDTPLEDGVRRFLHWAASERNQNSDAHRYSEAPIEDAWLMVHIVGALIVRLTSGKPRQPAQANK